MTLVVVAARDSSPADRAAADVVCDGRTDVAALAKVFAEPDREVLLVAGTYDGNAGFTSAGNRYLRPAENVTVLGAGPGGLEGGPPPRTGPVGTLWDWGWWCRPPRWLPQGQSPFIIENLLFLGKSWQKWASIHAIWGS